MLSVSMAAVSMIVAASLVVPGSSSAGSFPLTVIGEVRDSVGTLVENAQVDILDEDTGYTKTVFTDEFGQYQWDIPEGSWFNNDTIKIHAEYGSATGDNQGVAVDASPWMLQINVTLSEVIPEFGSVLGVLVAISMLGMVAVVVLGTKRRGS